jgi:hypothetical protein
MSQNAYNKSRYNDKDINTFGNGTKAMLEQTKTAMMTPTGRETNTIIINTTHTPC